jgi:hypothetical protein
MTVAAMNITAPPRSIFAAIADLLGFGYGNARFEVSDTGELIHTSTVVTVKMKPGEDPAVFLARLRADYDWQKGDTLEIMSEGGKLNTARITRVPRA